MSIAYGSRRRICLPVGCPRILTFGFSTSRPGRPTWNLVISNVPGPQFPLYMAGARLEAHYPVSVITDGVGLNITCLSYLDGIDFGIVCDREMVDDAWSIMAAVEAALVELDEAVCGKAPAARRPAPASSR